jgi:hypothetical protein
VERRWDSVEATTVTTLIGIAEGFDTINDQLKASRRSTLYCSPDKLNRDQLADILRKWVKASRAKSPRIDKAPPGPVLLYALQDTFPCSSDIRSGVVLVKIPTGKRGSWTYRWFAETSFSGRSVANLGSEPPP